MAASLGGLAEPDSARWVALAVWLALQVFTPVLRHVPQAVLAASKESHRKCHPSPGR